MNIQRSIPSANPTEFFQEIPLASPQSPIFYLDFRSSFDVVFEYFIKNEDFDYDYIEKNNIHKYVYEQLKGYIEAEDLSDVYLTKKGRVILHIKSEDSKEPEAIKIDIDVIRRALQTIVDKFPEKLI